MKPKSALTFAINLQQIRPLKSLLEQKAKLVLLQCVRKVLNVKWNV